MIRYIEQHRRHVQKLAVDSRNKNISARNYEDFVVFTMNFFSSMRDFG